MLVGKFGVCFLNHLYDFVLSGGIGVCYRVYSSQRNLCGLPLIGICFLGCIVVLLVQRMFQRSGWMCGWRAVAF